MKKSYHNVNCSICAVEFNLSELKSLASNKLNSTSFKICERCVDRSNPADDYRQAKEIAAMYLSDKETKLLFKEALGILNSLKK